MKWYVLIDDYDDYLGETLEKTMADPRLHDLLVALKGSIELSVEATFKTPGDALNAYCAHRPNFDQSMFVFNGHPMMAGPANDAMWTQCYAKPDKQPTITHYTSPLINRYVETLLAPSTAEKFVLEVMWSLLRRFCYDAELPSDGMSLEEKRRRIDSLESEWRKL